MFRKRKLPQIQIAYNRFLDPLAKAYTFTNPRWKDWTPPKIENVKEKVKIFNREWKKNEKKILSGLSDALSLNFQRNVIDVHVVSGIPSSFSNPIVLKSDYSPEDFVDVVSHELIHSLMQQNNTIASFRCVNWLKELYPKESQKTRNHIIVHAVLVYIYLEILNDKNRLLRNRERSLLHDTDEYTRAWEIVDAYGYKKLLKDHKSKYSKIKKAWVDLPKPQIQ